MHEVFFFFFFFFNICVTLFKNSVSLNKVWNLVRATQQLFLVTATLCKDFSLKKTASNHVDGTVSCGIGSQRYIHAYFKIQVFNT